MISFDILSLIPKSFTQQALDTLVEFVSDQAKKYATDEIATKIKKLHSDAAFNRAFEEGLERAAQRFVEEYEVEDEDLVAAIAADEDFFKNEEVQKALLAILKKPGLYLADERQTVAQSFDSVLPQRKNRERVDRAVVFLLKCLSEELWHLPELQPIYSLQFQRMTAEATRQQVELQKAQLASLTSLDAGVREALLQLTDVISERKALPAGDAPALAPPSSKPKVYHNLPQPDYGRFVGREQELAQVVRILRPYPHSQYPLVTIDGIGGIGKSALALEVAHRYLRNYDRIPREERFEAIIWTSAKQSVLTAEGIVSRSQALRTLDDIYTTIATTLLREDITRALPKEQAQVVRNALTRQRTLLIVDNLETVDDEAVMSFLRELPAPTKAVVTTRHRVDVAYPVRLVDMPWEDAWGLISQECDKKGVTLSKDDARRLYDRTGGVPLAIVWSIAQMGFGYVVDAVLARLGQPISDIARFCFEGALGHIRGKPAHKLLMALSLFVTNASREALGNVASLPGIDRDEGLVSLEKLSLINKTDRRFDLLPLTKSFAIGLIKQSPECEEILRQAFIQYFRDFCRKYGGARWRLYYYLDEDLKNIELALKWAYQLEMWQQVGDFVDDLAEFLDKRGLWNELTEYSEMAVEAGRETNNKRLVARHKQFGLGWIRAIRFGEFKEGLASVAQSKELSRRIGAEHEYARCLFSEGHLHQLLGNHNRSEELLQSSLAVWQRLEETRWEIRTIGMIGSNERSRGNLERAYEYLSQAQVLSEEAGDIEQSAVNLRRLSDILLRMGELDEACSKSKEALEISEQLNIPYGIAANCLTLAKAECSLGKTDEARERAHRAYEIFTKLGVRKAAEETAELLEALGQPKL